MNRFKAIRDYINNKGVGKELTYYDLIIASQVKGMINISSNTIYTYCRVLRVLGYLAKMSRYKLYVVKPIPEDKSYNELRKEYLEKISYPPCYKPIKD